MSTASGFLLEHNVGVSTTLFVVMGCFLIGELHCAQSLTGQALMLFGVILSQCQWLDKRDVNCIKVIRITMAKWKILILQKAHAQMGQLVFRAALMEVQVVQVLVDKHLLQPILSTKSITMEP